MLGSTVTLPPACLQFMLLICLRSHY